MTFVKNKNKMNNKFLIISIISIVIITCIFTIKKTSIQKSNSKDTDIEAINIHKYIPTDNELCLISSIRNKDLNQLIMKNYKDSNKKDLMIIKNGILSFLGFDYEDNLRDIYNGEIAICTFYNKPSLRDVLIIVKSNNKDKVDLLLDLENKYNKLDRIEDPYRVKYINNYYQTNDQYLILASNKELIIKSINSLHNKEVLTEREDRLRKVSSLINNKKLFIIINSAQVNKFFKENLGLNIETLITKFDIENNIIKYKTYILESLNNINSLGSEQKLIPTSLNESTNKFLSDGLIEVSNYLNIFDVDNFQKSIFEKYNREIKTKLFYANKEGLWTIGFIKPEKSLFSIESLDFLHGYNKSNLVLNEINYNVFYKENLNLENNKISLKKEIPIFLSESKHIIFISNSLSELENNIKNDSLSSNFIKDNKDLNSDNLILIDAIAINNNYLDKLFGNLSELKILKYFFSNSIGITIDNFKGVFSQKIPLKNPRIYFETEIKIS